MPKASAAQPQPNADAYLVGVGVVGFIAATRINRFSREYSSKMHDDSKKFVDG